MHHNSFKVAIFTSLYFLVSSYRFEVRPAWTPMRPAYGHFSRYQEIWPEKRSIRPHQMMGPITTNIDIQSPSPSHAQENPVSPLTTGSRVVVARRQSTNSTKNTQMPRNEGLGSAMNENDTTILNPISNTENINESPLQRIQLPLEAMEESQNDEVGNGFLEKVEAAKDLIPLPGISMLPDATLDNLKDSVVGTPLQKMDEVKNATLDMPANPMGRSNELKEDIISGSIQKVEIAKDMTPDNMMALLNGMNLDDLKSNIVNILVQKVEDIKNMPLDMMTKDSNPIGKAEDLKNELIRNFLQKVQETFNVVIPEIPMLPEIQNSVQKVEDLKNDTMNPVEKFEEPMGNLVRIPLEMLEAVKEPEMDKTMLPGELMPDLKEAISDISPSNMTAIKDAIVEKAVSPLETLANLKETMPVMIPNPVEKTEDVKEADEDKMKGPLNTLSSLSDPKGVVADVVSENIQAPMENIASTLLRIEKLEDVKEASLEKAQLPIQTIMSAKDAAANMQMPLNTALGKAENILNPMQDLKDVVFNAFRQSIVGDRKEYFKQAIGTMGKEELEDFHEALVSAFNMKGLMVPASPVVANVKEDLKEAVHELAMAGSDSAKKDALIALEHVIQPVIPAKDEVMNKPMEIAQKPIENIEVPAPLSDNLADAKGMMVDDQRFVEFGNSMRGTQNMTRRRRRDIASPRGRGVFSRQNKNKGWGRGKRSIYGIGTPNQELHNFRQPAGLLAPIKTAFRQVNSAAPPDPYPKSKDSLSLPLLTMNEPATDKIMMDIKEGLQYIFQTKNDWTFAIHGTGTTGCHAVLDNLIESGDKVLALINGYWGELMANMSERLGAQVVRYNKRPGTVFTLMEIETALLVHRPDLVLVVQGESSTTVNQPLDGIGELCAKNGALLIADVVAVAGIQPVLMDKNKIDAVFTSSTKGLGGVAGLAPISLSPRALEKLNNRLTPPRAYQTDLKRQRELWNTANPDRTRFQSLSLPLLYGLREALATIVEEKMENTFRRHELTTEHLNRGLAALGLEHFVENPNDRLIGITAVKPPVGKDPSKIAKYMFKNYNIEISSGFGPTAGKVLRIATFASNADTLRVSKLLRALKNALSSRETSASY